MHDHDPLLDRFLLLWKNIGAGGDAHKVYYQLRKQYEYPRRFYHTFEGHIGHCLREMDAALPYTKHSECAVASIFFHDANMSDLDHKANELRSAIYASNTFRKAGCSKKFCWMLSNNILATRHMYGVAWNDAKVVMDVDLSILGQSSEVFNEYEEQIRQEYINIPWDAYRVGRIKFLCGILSWYCIYQTSFFREKYEKQAKENIIRSITNLEKS